MAECPVCGFRIDLNEVQVHEVVECPACGSELEIVSIDPMVLEELPEIEEDWGE